MDAIVTRSLREVMCKEWKYWLTGAVFSFFLASVLLSGWPAGLIPNMQYPFDFTGDSLSYGWLVERVREGWAFVNPRSGYPFGANFLDYPGSEGGNYLIIKIISLFTTTYAATSNLYVLLSFSAIFAVSFCVCRAMALNIPFSFAAALLYAFTPFHFQRMGHLFYLWYFVVPLFYYMAFAATPFGWKQKLLWGLALVFLSSFGVYYALFGLIVIAVAKLFGMVESNSIKGYRFSLFLCFAIVAGVLINVAPNILYKYEQGPGKEPVAKRFTFESETYGLKFVQLLLPAEEHRIPSLSNLAKHYSLHHIVNENRMSNLGMMGAAGFVALLGVLFVAAAGRPVDNRLRCLSIVSLVLFMFGTIGGFGTVFAMVVSPSIRAWNRISIFICFGSLVAFFLMLQLACEKRLSQHRYLAITAGLAIVLSVIGIYDQTPRLCETCIAQTKNEFNTSKAFVEAIEASLPKGSAIYQLPYIGFPEVPPRHDLWGYEFLKGFIHSKDLHWSYGGMKGREGDMFFRALSDKPMKEQLKVIREMGFAGIYIEKRGYADHGKAIIHELTELLGAPPALTSSDNEVVFFRLKDE